MLLDVCYGGKGDVAILKYRDLAISIRAILPARFALCTMIHRFVWYTDTTMTRYLVGVDEGSGDVRPRATVIKKMRRGKMSRRIKSQSLPKSL